MPDYDAVVIGSGAGGMTTALALARAGKRVAVFEQHDLVGGYSQSFDLRGFQFSPGVHYIGELGPGESLRRIYEGLGVADDLLFFELNPDGFEHVIVGDERFDIPKGAARFRARLLERFPSEADGINRYLDLVDRMAAEIAWARPQRLLDKLALPLRMPTTLRCGLVPLSRLLDRLTTNPLLRAILSIQAGAHGMAPSRVPAVVHAGLQRYYMNGACYPRGGSHAIPLAFAKQLAAYGGTVQLRTEVARVLVERGRAIGVALADGREVRADVVVCNADPAVLWTRLVAAEHVSAALRRRIRKLRWSAASISLLLATDMDLRAAGLDSGNIWYSRTPDIDATYRMAELHDFDDVRELPGLFFNVTTLKDPTLRRDGLHTAEAITLTSWDAFSRWGDTGLSNRRPAAYQAVKQRIRELMLDTIERFVPGISAHIVYAAVTTPLTNHRYLAATRGAIYGPENSLRQSGLLRFSVATQLPGLFQCGASTICPGIHGATRSGLAVAAAVLGCAESELLGSTGQSLRVLPAERPECWPLDMRPTASMDAMAG